MKNGAFCRCCGSMEGPITDGFCDAHREVIPSEASQGWHRPPTSRKFHWFIRNGSESLCRRYGFAFHAELQADSGNKAAGPQDCVVCFKRLVKMRGENDLVPCLVGPAR